MGVGDPLMRTALAVALVTYAGYDGLTLWLDYHSVVAWYDWPWLWIWPGGIPLVGVRNA